MTWTYGPDFNDSFYDVITYVKSLFASCLRKMFLGMLEQAKSQSFCSGEVEGRTLGSTMERIIGIGIVDEFRYKICKILTLI